MNSATINFEDLSIAREIIPFLRLRLRILKQRVIGVRHDAGSNILIVMPCIVGDCLSILPAVRSFAEQTQTSFDILVSPDFRSLAERLKGVRRVYVASSSYNRASELQHQSQQELLSEYDLIIVLRLSPSAFELIRHIRCSNIISSDATILKYLLHMAKSSLLKRPVRQSRELMFEVLGLSSDLRTDGLYTLFDIDGDGRDISADFPAVLSHGRKVLIHAGSGWKVKLWSDDNWVELLRRIHSLGAYQFIFVGKGEEEESAFKRLKEKFDFPVHSLINSTNLWELFLIMRRCDYFIGIDSGPRNLAHYANLRSVTLLNPAAVKNFMPLDEQDIVVENPNRFPANLVNTSRRASLMSISVQQVFDAFRRLVAIPRQVSGNDKLGPSGPLPKV